MGKTPLPPKFAFGIEKYSDLTEPGRIFSLSLSDVMLMNPNTLTSPVFRDSRRADITRSIYQRLPIMFHEATQSNPWSVKFMTMFHMSNDSKYFYTQEKLVDENFLLDGNTYQKGNEIMMPLYEAKMMHQFDHRFATYETPKNTIDVSNESKEDHEFTTQPKYWISSEKVAEYSDNRNLNQWFK